MGQKRLCIYWTCLVFITALSLSGSWGGYTKGEGRVYSWMSCQFIYEQLWFRDFAQGYLGIVLKVFQHLAYFVCLGAWTENPPLLPTGWATTAQLLNYLLHFFIFTTTLQTEVHQRLCSTSVFIMNVGGTGCPNSERAPSETSQNYKKRWGCSVTSPASAFASRLHLSCDSGCEIGAMWLNNTATSSAQPLKSPFTEVNKAGLRWNMRYTQMQHYSSFILSYLKYIYLSSPQPFPPKV